jgi:hypothetical protein
MKIETKRNIWEERQYMIKFSYTYDQVLLANSEVELQRKFFEWNNICEKMQRAAYASNTMAIKYNLKISVNKT